MVRTWIAFLVAGVEILASTAALADRPAYQACRDGLRSSSWGSGMGGAPIGRELIETYCAASPPAGALACMNTSRLSFLGPAEYTANFGVATDFCRRNPSEPAGSCFWTVYSSTIGLGTYDSFGAYHADQLCSLAVPRGVPTTASLNCVDDLMGGVGDPSAAIQLCGRDSSEEARLCYREKKGEGYPQWPLAQICGSPLERTMGIACLSDLVGQGFSKQFSASFCAQNRSPVARACIANARELGVPLAVGVAECLRNPSAPNFALIPAAPIGHCLSASSVPGEMALGTRSTGQPAAFAATP